MEVVRQTIIDELQSVALLNFNTPSPAVFQEKEALKGSVIILGMPIWK